MRHLLLLFSLVLASGIAAHSPLSSEIFSTRTDLSLANFLLSQQTVSTNSDATTSAQCYSIYLPLLNNVTNSWSANHSSCITNANSERDTLMSEMQIEQNAMSNTASGLCQFVMNCQNIVDSKDFFNCFSVFSSNYLYAVYGISNNASNDATFMNQQLDSIDYNMYKCTNDTERAYIVQTGQIYDALDYCLHNGVPLEVSPTTVEPTKVTDESTEVTRLPTFTETAIAETTIVVETLAAKKSFGLALLKFRRKFGY